MYEIQLFCITQGFLNSWGTAMQHKIVTTRIFRVLLVKPMFNPFIAKGKLKLTL